MKRGTPNEFLEKTAAMASGRRPTTAVFTEYKNSFRNLPNSHLALSQSPWRRHHPRCSRRRRVRPPKVTVHADDASRTSSTHHPSMSTPAWPQHLSTHATSHTTRHIDQDRLVPIVEHGMSCLCCSVILLLVQESAVASHKCRFRVRHFGRVLKSPYTSRASLSHGLHRHW